MLPLSRIRFLVTCLLRQRPCTTLVSTSTFFQVYVTGWDIIPALENATSMAVSSPLNPFLPLNSSSYKNAVNINKLFQHERNQLLHNTKWLLDKNKDSLINNFKTFSALYAKFTWGILNSSDVFRNFSDILQVASRQKISRIFRGKNEHNFAL